MAMTSSRIVSTRCAEEAKSTPGVTGMDGILTLRFLWLRFLMNWLDVYQA